MDHVTNLTIIIVNYIRMQQLNNMIWIFFPKISIDIILLFFGICCVLG